MDKATMALARYVQDKGLSISAIERNTNIPKNALYQSLGANATRTLRADEYLSICEFVEKSPLDFYTPQPQLQQTGT